MKHVRLVGLARHPLHQTSDLAHARRERKARSRRDWLEAAAARLNGLDKGQALVAAAISVEIDSVLEAAAQRGVALCASPRHRTELARQIAIWNQTRTRDEATRLTFDYLAAVFACR